MFRIVSKITNWLLLLAGEFWRQTGATTMAGPLGSLRLATDRFLVAAELHQKLYIADNGTAVHGSDGVISGTNGLTFTNSAGTNFGGAGVTANDHVLVVSDDGAGTNAVQTIGCAGVPTGGTFKIGFVSGTTTHWTSGLAYNVNASTTQAALRALPGVGDVTCAGGALPAAPITVTFTGDLAATSLDLLWVDDEDLTGGGVNEIHTITITGTPSGGTFSFVVVDPNGLMQHTPNISYNAIATTAAETGSSAGTGSGESIQSKLESMSLLDSGDITCAGGPLPGTPITVTFTNDWGSESLITLFREDSSALTGGSSPAVDVTETTAGSGPYISVEATTEGASDEIDLGVYEITNVSTSTLTLATTPSQGGATAFKFRIDRTIKVYDPDADTLTGLLHTPGKGTVPTNCTIATSWRGRLVVVDSNDPHNFKMSRQNDPKDWDYFEDDAGRAVAGNLASAGHIGEPITAIIPFHHSCLLIGCTSSCWAITGDLAMGGTAKRLDDEIGMLDKKAWCFVAGGGLFFMSRDGLYVMPPGCGTAPQSVSRESLPEELLNIDTASYTVTMAYDTRFRGAHLFLYNGSNTDHWFIDIKTRMEGDRVSASFWPVSYQADHGPSASYGRRDLASADSAVVFGGKDGYLRHLKTTLDQDDGSTISSHIVFGPFALGDSKGVTEGKLTSLCATLARGSGNVTWSVHVGQTAEDAVNAAARESGTWTGYSDAGLQYKAHPRARGGYATVKITSTGT